MTSFMGRILHVNLSDGMIRAIEISPEVYEAVLAGKAPQGRAAFASSAMFLLNAEP